MTKAPPSISILTPAYNAERTLANTVASLQAQTNPDWEVIIVDDGSTDGTRALMDRLAAEEPRITVAHQENSGASSARNTAMKYATGRWMMFLDSDDDFQPDAVEQMLSAAAAALDPRWLYAGWKRILPSGEEELHPPMFINDAVEICSQYCPFAISASMVDRELVMRLGGFDTTLRTCEDWDLWLRMAMAGATPVAVQAFISNYRARPKSLSTDARSMIGDGLIVINRGFAFSGRPDPARRSARAGHLAWTSGLMLGLGEDPAELLDQLDDPYAPDVDPGAVAGALITAIPLGGLDTAHHWTQLTDDDHRRITRFLEELERVTGSPRLARRCARRLELLVSEAVVEGTGYLRLGAAVIIDIDLGQPLQDLDLGPDIERMYLRARLDGQVVGSTAEVPVFGPHFPAVVALDALLETAGWDTLERFILTPLLPSLTVEGRPEGWTIMRAGTPIAPVLVEHPTDRQLLDATGWALFMQLLWGDDSLQVGPLYEATGTVAGVPRTVGAHTTFEISDDLPELFCTGDSVTVEVTLGGAPLDCFTLAARNGGVTAVRLRQQICIRAGVQLSHGTLRTLLSNGRLPGPGLRADLRDLAERAQATRPAAGLSSAWATVAQQIAGDDVGGVRLIGRATDSVPTPGSFRVSLIGGSAAEQIERIGAARNAPTADVTVGKGTHHLAALAPLAAVPSGAALPAPPDASLFVPDFGDGPASAPAERSQAVDQIARFARRPRVRWIRNRFRGAVDRHDQRGETQVPESAAPAYSGPRVPIMMYHRVAPDGPPGVRQYRVTPEELRSQLEMYTREGFTSILPEQWRDAICLGAPLPPKPIMLTFDDGFQDFHDFAVPLLEEYGMNATVMLVSELVGKWNRWDGDRDPQPLMDWDTIEKVRARGFNFGGHTRNHYPLAALGADEAVDEMAGSMEAVAERLGSFPVSFAYPFGDLSDAIRRLAGSSGIDLAFSVDAGVATKDSDLLRLPRIEVVGAGSVERLWKSMNS